LPPTATRPAPHRQSGRSSTARARQPASYKFDAQRCQAPARRNAAAVRGESGITFRAGEGRQCHYFESPVASGIASDPDVTDECRSRHQRCCDRRRAGTAPEWPALRSARWDRTRLRRIKIPETLGEFGHRLVSRRGFFRERLGNHAAQWAGTGSIGFRAEEGGKYFCRSGRRERRPARHHFIQHRRHSATAWLRCPAGSSFAQFQNCTKSGCFFFLRALAQFAVGFCLFSQRHLKRAILTTRKQTAGPISAAGSSIAQDSKFNNGNAC